MDPLRSQVLQPFPTPGSGTLWVAGESLRDRRVSCLPRWTECPTRSPLLGPNRGTCRGECSWSGPLVTPPGRCHRGPLTNGPGRIPPYCVCSGGADTVTGGAPKPLRLGPSPASPVGPFCPAPHFAVWFAVVGFPSLPGGPVVVGGAFRFSWPCCLCACPQPLWLWFAVGVCVCGPVRARVVSVLVCVSCVRGRVGVGVPSVCVGACVCVCGCVAGAGRGLLVVWVWVWSVCAVVGPSLAGVRWRRWCVVCGVWFVVCGVRRWCVGGVVAGVWCGWSLTTLGGGSCVLLPATPGWVLLPVVVGVPRHSWLRVPGAVPRHSWLGSAGGGGVWFVVCGVRRWCVGGVLAGVWCGWSLATPGGGPSVLLPANPGWVSLPVVVGVPRHSWLRVPGAVPRHSWLGFTVGGGGRSSPLLAEGPGCGSPPVLPGVRWRRWCVVCGVWCVVCGVRRWCIGGAVAGVWCGWSLATPGGGSCVLLSATPGWGPLAAVVCGGVVAGVWCGWSLASAGGGSCVLLSATPGWASLPVVVGVRHHSWRRVPGAVPRHSWLGFAVRGGVLCVVCGVWCVVCGGGVLVGLWLVCGVVGPSPLLAEVPVCYSPPLLAWFRCRW